MRRDLVAAPTIEPVTADEMKDMLHLTDDNERNYIDTIIPVAREHVEKLTWRRLITQTWDFYVNQFVTPGGYVYTWDIAKGQVPFPVFLPYPPVQTISYVKYLDPAGVQQTLATSVYELGMRNGIGILRLKYGQYWPAVRNQEDSVTIRMVCGYGAAAANVPAALRHAIRLAVAHMFWNREPVAEKALANVPKTFDDLIRPYQVKTRI
jgi:uncharacterized phiE125 gp8 family phage protein